MAPSISRADRRRFLPAMTVVAVLAALALLVWFTWPSGGGAQRERVIQEITLVTPPPPPPPPEPEEKIMEEEQEIIEPTENPKPQQDVDTPTEAPSDAPAEAPSSEAAGLDRPADAGSDSYRLSAGGGGGLFGRGGGGGGGGGWGQFVETHVRRALQRDPRTRTAQGFLKIAVTIDENGRFTSAALRSSTGDQKLDLAIRDVLTALPPLSRGRPPKVSGLTFATINMKRLAG